ncbi:hypothetical protein BDFB_004085 [Asbolus verrucosus]|uniref:Uncharacterized protein n=1 Tax=Asbolus verrucosus TaxID=1661398 RepID=A0A482VWD8_ASBVE|nr:hypothetical protein BDFB_004085 [Asbolus verrucosus]
MLAGLVQLPLTKAITRELFARYIWINSM